MLDHPVILGPLGLLDLLDQQVKEEELGSLVLPVLRLVSR